MTPSQIAVFRASAAAGDGGFEAFREHIGKTILRLEMSPLGDGPLVCNVAVRALPELAIATGNISPMISRHPESLGDDAITLAAVGRGTMELASANGSLTIENGAGVLTANADPGTLTGYTLTELTTIRLDRKLLSRYLIDPEAALGQAVQGNSVGMRLLLNYAGVLGDPMVQADAETQQLVVSNVYDLVAATFGPARDARGHLAGIRAARLAAVRDEMRQRFRQPLTIGEVAKRHGISTSYLRQLFAGAGTSFTEQLLHYRLAAAHRALRDVRHVQQGVSAIAFDCGFGDLSYFNRTFRHRYGMTPSEAREAGLRRP